MAFECGIQGEGGGGGVEVGGKLAHIRGNTRRTNVMLGRVVDGFVLRGCCGRSRRPGSVHVRAHAVGDWWGRAGGGGGGGAGVRRDK